MFLDFAAYIHETKYVLSKDLRYVDETEAVIRAGLFLNYLDWVIAQIKLNDNRADPKDYTATDLMVELRYIGEYLTDQHYFENRQEPINLIDVPAEDLKIRDEQKKLISHYDTAIFSGIVERLDGNNTEKLQHYKKISTVWNIFNLAVMAFSFTASYYMPAVIPGYAISIGVVVLLIVGIAGSVWSSWKMKECNPVYTPDSFTPGNTAYQHLTIKNGVLHRHEVPEAMPKLVDFTLEGFNTRRKAVTQTIELLNSVITQYDDVRACTHSALLTQRYASLYSNYDDYVALKTEQFSQRDMGQEKPLDLEPLAEALRTKQGWGL